MERLSIRATFNNALIKLTLIYTGILLFVSIVFSISFYQVSVRELDASYIAQSQIIQRRPAFRTIQDQQEFIEEQIEELDKSKARVFGRLVAGNMIVLAGSALLSYFLAKKSLEPIEDAHQAQSRFTADASHELRTPITAMQTEIEVALRDKGLTKKEARDLLGSNLEELGKLSGLSDALLRLARRDDGSSLHKVTIDTLKVYEDAKKRLRPKFNQKKITVSHKIPKDMRIVADYDMITEVFVIILENAIKYSPEDSKITVSAKRRGRLREITFTDKGQGIKATELPHIFDRFYRADSSRTQQGYGLGLSLAKQIVELHGGHIKVTSTPEKGTSMTIVLPS